MHLNVAADGHRTGRMHTPGAGRVFERFRGPVVNRSLKMTLAASVGAGRASST